MSSNTVRASLLALILFVTAGFLGYRYWTAPKDPNNGNFNVNDSSAVTGRLGEVAKLGERGPEAGPEATSTLIAALKDPDPDLRAEAARAFGKVGFSTPEAKAALDAAEKDAEPMVRSAVLGAFDNQARAAKSVDDPRQARYETAVLAALKDKASGVRRTAMQTLRSRPEGGLANVEAITKAELATLDDADPATRTYTLAALSALPKIAGPKLDQASLAALIAKVPDLIKTLPGADMRSRPEYQGLLRTIAATSRSAKATTGDTQAQAIRAALLEVLTAKEADGRSVVFPIVPTVAPLARLDVPFVKQAFEPALADANGPARRAAAHALRDLLAQDDSLAPAALELLRPRLKDEDLRLRAIAYVALAGSPAARQAGGDALKAELREATGAMIAELSKPDSPSLEVAAWGLSWTDPQDADAALTALKALKDVEDEGLKNRVAQATAALEAAKAAGSWPEPSWKPFSSGPTVMVFDAGPLSGGNAAPPKGSDAGP